MVICIGGLCALHSITALFCIWLKLTLADVSQEIGVLTGSKRKINYYNVSDVGLDGRPKSYKQLLNSFKTGMIFAVDYHWDKKLVFGITHDGTIYRTSFDAAPVQALLVTDDYDWELAVDWVHDRLIFPTRNGSLWQGRGLAIVSTDLHGGNLTVLLTRSIQMEYMRRIAIDPYAGKMFWIYWFQPYIESCNLDGTEYKSIKKSMRIIQMSLDLPSRKVFLVDSMGSLYSMDYTGENLRKHWTMTETPIGFDVLDGRAYWFNNMNEQFIFYKLDTNQTTLPEKLFFTDGDPLYQMRIVHPSVQEKPCSSGRWTYYDCATTTERSDTSIPDHVFLFIALLSVVLLGLVVFVIRKYNTQSHNELSIANVNYNPMSVE